MQISFFRSSSYNAWDICQQQYFLNYILGIPVEAGKSALLGTMTHKVLEILAIAKKLEQDNKPLKIVDNIGKYNFKKLPSNSDIDKLCNDSYNYYKKHSNRNFVALDLTHICKWVHSVTDSNFDPRKLNIVDAEHPFIFPIKQEWAKLPNGEYLQLKGTIDLIIKQSDKLYEVIDWKTGARKNWSTGEEKTLNKLYQDPQLLIYNLAILNDYGVDNNYMATIHYINDGGPYTITFNKNSAENILQLLKDRYQEILSCVYPELKNGGKHWFCTKVCEYSKILHPSNMSICSFINKRIIMDGIEDVIKKETAVGHTIDKYQAPG